MLGEGYVPHPLNDNMLRRSASTSVNDLSTSPVARVLDKLPIFSHFRPFMFVSDTLSPPKKEKLALLDASIGLFICKEVRALYGT